MDALVSSGRWGSVHGELQYMAVARVGAPGALRYTGSYAFPWCPQIHGGSWGAPVHVHGKHGLPWCLRGDGGSFVGSSSTRPWHAWVPLVPSDTRGRGELQYTPWNAWVSLVPSDIRGRGELPYTAMARVVAPGAFGDPGHGFRAAPVMRNYRHLCNVCTGSEPVYLWSDPSEGLSWMERGRAERACSQADTSVPWEWHSLPAALSASRGAATAPGTEGVLAPRAGFSAGGALGESHPMTTSLDSC
ncbi:hypothetical protein NDU88_006791 [Pleurodeles waltl]|uniref:Uncharacterized protein n=1 Tax=Pleurodeles waltl TaxID=8319 RepID=A0AAV7WEK8_PLEWA|nr:hypothetical protein NDU88_006791 [Pleurodeles waltl]